MSQVGLDTASEKIIVSYITDVKWACSNNDVDSLKNDSTMRVWSTLRVVVIIRGSKR